MLSKSKFYATLYGLIAFVVVGLFNFGLISDWLAKLGLANQSPEAIACLSLIATGLVARLFGGNKHALIIIGITAIFFVLVLHQELVMLRYMILSAVLFSIGVYGLIASRNAIRMLISIELMINAANINFVTLARSVDPSDIKGQIFAIFVLAVAAAEAAVGLAIVLAIYRNQSTVNMDEFNLLKW